jgi:hypothetical protein
MRIKWTGVVLGFLFLGGCDPVASLGIVVRPLPATRSDRSPPNALQLGARVAARHGLQEQNNLEVPGIWKACYAQADAGWWFCERQLDNETQFHFYAPLKRQLPTYGDRVRRELVDSLKRAFGAATVRECKWQIASQPSREGCWPAGDRPSKMLPGARVSVPSRITIVRLHPLPRLLAPRALAPGITTSPDR